MKDKSIEKLQKEKCSGCSACYPVCPTNAITMEYDEEGFLYPIVIHEKCTNCGLCSKVCPELNFEFDNKKTPQCYAMQAADEIRMKSSSGGMFTILADYIFERGGFVCGVAFNKNENWKVEHIIIEKKEDLDKLRGSKYVQSDKKDIFKKIKELLGKDKYVLFSGCPCEVAGLKNFLRKDYDKLILVDLLCLGVPPPKLWELYLKENFYKKDIKNISFRDKTFYKWSSNMNVYFENGDIYRQLGSIDTYLKTFHRSISLRKSCYSCSYKGIPKSGDITIGDFWGIDKFIDINDKDGTSIIFINNEKAFNIIEDIKQNFKLFFIFPNDKLKFLPNSIYGCSKKPEVRKSFFDNVYKEGINKTTKYYVDDYCDVGLLNFGYSSNYGSCLTSYSIFYNVKKLGYSIKHIAYIPKFIYDKYKGYNKKFHNKYVNHTKIYHTKRELQELNNKINTFIVGADTIWQYNSDNLFNFDILKNKNYYDNIYFLHFVNLDKNLISFAPSFARNDYYGDYKNRLMTSYDLSRFDHISVREKDAIGLIKRLFNIENVEQVIEPVFILDYEEWDKIIADSSLNHKGKLAYYLLDPTEEKEEAVKYISEKLNIETIDAGGNFFREVEDFLYIMKNADFVITDSFHGTCFSTIFKKQFISFLNKERGESRYALFEELKLRDRIINNFDELKNKKDLFDKIDYAKTFEIIKKEKERAILWLKNALKNKRDKKITPQLSMIEYLIYENDSLDLKLKEANNEIINLQNRNLDLQNNINNNLKELNDSLINKINEKQNWIKLFGIYNTKDYLIFYLFGIKISFKINEERVNKLAWWIPIRKWRDNFRNKFFDKFIGGG